ncbi:GATA transcription factor 26-like [Chenopodium quinoa]|uniref:GATA transcription factor 26-like n=1 Tax=Chenopodium quinoa TaxID=63459 RepID=UPI000B788BF4|nr:GATA transcription factor 26-like [Chenopodium quinoa]
MGKQGPCYHCGVTSTPLWRNGPPEKPVLCNACGSRWRTKGTLANYTPLHSRVDPDEYEDHRVGRVKTMSLKKRDDKISKRKYNYENSIDGDFIPDYSQGFQKNIDEDTSNRSSSGSAISNSESCAQFGSAEASELTGPAQSIVWDALVPSRKRTCVTRAKQSSVEKLTKDLYTILHEQQASHPSVSSEDDLLYESEAPMVSVEIGHGSVLIRHPSSIARDEESEASSLSVENKLCRTDEGYSNPASMLLFNDSKSVGSSCLGVEKVKRLNGHILQLEQVKREKYNNESIQLLWNHDSLLCDIDLTEIVNPDVFRGHLTDKEQQDLLKYLPTVDTSSVSDSLGSIFTSTHFKENISSFQKLLADGVFDTSFSGIQTEDCKVLKRLALSNMTKCNWVEYRNSLKDKRTKESTGESVRISEAKSCFSGNFANAKRSRESQTHRWPETNGATKIPKRVLLKVDCKSKQPLQYEGSCLTPAPKNLFTFPTNGSSLMLDSYQFEDESSDQDLLLDVPSNGSYPQAEAELLCPTSSFASQQASSSSIPISHFRP